MLYCGGNGGVRKIYVKQIKIKGSFLPEEIHLISTH
jgi:hypothetical protein